MDKNRQRERIILFIGISLLVHAFLLVVVYKTQFAREIKIPDNTVFVDLDKLPPPPQQAADAKKPRQVVESEVAEQTKPKEAKYLGERDQSVEKETKAKQVESFRKGGAPAKLGAGGKPSQVFKNLAPPTAKTVLKPPTQAEIDGWKEQEKVARQEHSAGGPAGAENPGSATNDYLKDTKDGDKTLLNTKEFVYFSYYRRIRQKLEVAWNAKLRGTLDTYVYGGRRLANDRNYVTGVVVVLDRNGKITAVRVLQKSGARDLDDAAVGAFNDAGPFPDPPSGLVDQNGQIEVRWDFILQS